MSHTEYPTTPGFFEGLLLAIAGVPDAFVLHDSPGCILEKADKVGAKHDLRSTLLESNGRHRWLSSELNDRDLVFGTEKSLRGAVLQIARSVRPGVLLLSQSAIAVVAGTDADAIARDLEDETGLAIATVRSAPLSGCHLDGFANAAEALARNVELRAGEPVAGSVAVIGFPLTRLEADDEANLAELARTCEALGLTPASVWFDGDTSASLSRVARAEHLLALPYARGAAGVLGARLGRPVLPVELPIGLGGTEQWVRSLGEATGRSSEAEAFIARELDLAVPRLEWAIPRGLLHRSVAIVADPHLAPGLVSFAAELGLRVRLVGLHARDRQAAAQVERALAAVGQAAPVLVDPSFPELERRWAELHARGELDLVIGTSNERDAAKALRVPYLELGYPSLTRHALTPSPTWGFRGALWLADAMFNLIAAAEHGAY